MRSVGEIFGDFALALTFFTRLPLPGRLVPQRLLGDAIWAAPLAGVVVAAIGFLAYTAAVFFALSPLAAAGFALAAMLLATGALHEDGLADTADGFGGGRTRERTLEIMRDSRIGSYGALALGLSLLLRATLIADIAVPTRVLLALVAAHAASRAMLPLAMALLPSARVEGLSAGAGHVTMATAGVALALGTLALLPLGAGAAFAAIVAGGVVFAGFGWLCLRKIGGRTGDTLGALQQLTEIAVLAMASAYFHD